MPLIEPYKVQEIKNAARIEEVIMREGVELKKTGSSYKGQCPFHNGNSFTVTPAKGIFKCFGCGTGGDAVKFLMLKKGFDYPTALRALAEQFHVTI